MGAGERTHCQCFLPLQRQFLPSIHIWCSQPPLTLDSRDQCLLLTMAGTRTHTALIHQHTLHLAANTYSPDPQEEKAGRSRTVFGYLASLRPTGHTRRICPVQHKTKTMLARRDGRISSAKSWSLQRDRVVLVMVDLEKHEESTLDCWFIFYNVKQ